MAKNPHNNRHSGLKGVAQTVAQSEETRVPKYTEKRGSVFWFKRRAPKPLLPSTPIRLDDQDTQVGKNGYVKFSLRTSSPKEAGALARKYAHLLDELIKRLAHKPGATTSQTTVPGCAASRRSGPALVHPSELTPQEIESAASRMYAAFLDADEKTHERALSSLLSPEMGGKTEGSDTEDPREPDRYSWTSADLPPQTLRGEVELINRLMHLISFWLYQTHHKVIDEPGPQLIPFAREFRRFVQAMEQRRAGVEVKTPTPTPETLTLSALYEKFKTYKIATKSWKDPVVQDSREYGPTVREFIKLIGDKDAHRLTLKDAEKYFEHTMSRSDIQLGTMKRNFYRIKALLNFGGKKFGIPNITGPLNLESSYKKTHNSYERFTPSELKNLFHSEAYKTCSFKKASQFWLPLMGLYTGARLDELASLPIDKIQEIDGVWCYFVSSADANKGGKNQFAPRWMPIHPKILSAGFLEHWKTVKSEGHTRLFPELGNAQRDGPGKRGTEDFIAYRRSVGIGSVEGRGVKTFHSFRSTLVTELITRKTDDYVRFKLLGHSTTHDEQSHKNVHYEVYDQSNFDARRALEVLSKADFGLEHPPFKDTLAMKKARRRHRQKAQRSSIRPAAQNAATK